MKAFKPRVKVSVTVPDTIVVAIDNLVRGGSYPNRSAAFEDALRKLLRACMDAQIEAEVAKLDRVAEVAEAGEGTAV